MREAVVVSVARTPIGRAYRGAWNDVQAQALAGHAIRAALDKAHVEPHLVEDVLLGCALPQGSSGLNVARQSALRAGLPATVPGMTIDRQCSSGLMAVATAAKQILTDGMQVVVAGGVESVSLVQNEHMNRYRTEDPYLVETVPALYMSMVETAEIVAQRYRITRERQDEYALESQRRTAAAQAGGAYDEEISPLTALRRVVDKATGRESLVETTLRLDEGNRPDTTLEGLSSLSPVFTGGQRLGEGRSVTAGNASQLSDGAAALVLMEAGEAGARGLTPLGAYRGMAVTGCDPEEMGVGPVHAVPKLLSRHGLTVDDIDLWEINEAFASQLLYCRDALGIPPDRLNVSGGAISIGHPYGMTGARSAGHLLVEGHRRGARYGVVSMCVGGGMGAAALLEIF